MFVVNSFLIGGKEENTVRVSRNTSDAHVFVCVCMCTMYVYMNDTKIVHALRFREKQTFWAN